MDSMELSHGHVITLEKAKELGVLDAAPAIVNQGPDKPLKVLTPLDFPVRLDGDGDDMEDEDKEKSKMSAAMSLVEGALAHKEDEFKKEHHPKKHLKEMRVRRGHKGGYVVEHHHQMPDVHPMEEHPMSSTDDLHDHIENHMGEPNPGEAEADAGNGMAAAPMSPMAGV